MVRLYRWDVRRVITGTHMTEHANGGFDNRNCIIKTILFREPIFFPLLEGIGIVREHDPF
jgi:hypothetical protein